MDKDPASSRALGLAAAARVVVAIHVDDDESGAADRPGGDAAPHAADPASADHQPRSLAHPLTGSPAQPLPSIRGYAIHRPLGGGGGGDVYLATRNGSDRPLALKILATRLGSGRTAERAWRELDVLSHLHVAATPRVIDYGLHEGRLFIATEYVEGLPLDEYCERGTPSLGDGSCGTGVSPVVAPSLGDPEEAPKRGIPKGAERDGPSGDGDPSWRSPLRTAPHGRRAPASPPHLLTGSPAQTQGDVAHPLDLHARVSLIARVADAVHSLHERGIIHRDLKPSNILIDAHADPVIIDLGLAMLTADGSPEPASATLTLEGAPLGTPAFMAPEQARGERSAISTRTDVYSLGATACAILTGHTPHDLSVPNPRTRNPALSTRDSRLSTDDSGPRTHDSGLRAKDSGSRTEHHGPAQHSERSTQQVSLHEAIRRVAQDPPRDPRSLNPDLPKPLAAVLLKALAPRPADRYASAAGFAADLRRWLNREPVTAQPPTPWTRATRWIARHPIVTTAAACTTIAAATLVGTVVAASSAVWYVNQKPAYIRMDGDGRSATLYTVAGQALKTWTAAGNGLIPLAEFIDYPSGSGGGKAVVIGWPLSPATPLASQIAVYRFPDLEIPVWVSNDHDDPVVLPQPFAAVKPPDPWSATEVDLADVFSEYPGPEVIAVHTNEFSQRCIRIYAMGDGEVLFECWHNGGIGDLHWLPEPGYLVLSGDNHEATVGELGIKTERAHVPHVLWALQPRLHERVLWVHGPDSTREARSLVAWYRCIWPPEAWDIFTVSLRPPRDPANARASVDVQFQWPGKAGERELSASIRRRLDAEGHFLPEPPQIGDWAARSPPPLDPKAIELVHLPKAPGS